MSEERYNPAFLTNEEHSREKRQTAEMVRGFAKKDLEQANENGNQTTVKKPLKSFSLKVDKKTRIDIPLKEG